MKKQPQFLLVRVAADAQKQRLHLHFADGMELSLDMVPLLREYPVLACLRDPAVFRAARVAEHGRVLRWAGDEDLELASDNLRARAIEQAGGFSHETIWNWMHRHKLTLDQAARELDLSRRMLAYYRSGEKQVPRVVGLAILGWEQEHRAA